MRLSNQPIMCSGTVHKILQIQVNGLQLCSQQTTQFGKQCDLSDRSMFVNARRLGRVFQKLLMSLEQSKI